jgi:hypothetical protein
LTKEILDEMFLTGKLEMKIFSPISLLIGGGFALMAAAGGPAYAEKAATGSSSPKFIVCSGQTYALCAVASCFVMDNVAYCECEVKSGDSISLSYAFGNGENVCSVNAEGAENGYMVSTFSVPDSVVAPDGNQALYTCPASTSNGAYAQCDGSFCFTSTEGESFPGFNGPLNDGQIICSCPITVADPATARAGYQIAGPYPCQKSFFKNCKRATANKKTGAQIYVGAPAGSARLLARLLNGSVPTLNRCLP